MSITVFFVSDLYSQLGNSTGEFHTLQLIVLLSLRCLVPWISNLHPVCLSTFWKLVLNNSLFDVMEYTFFHCFSPP